MSTNDVLTIVEANKRDQGGFVIECQVNAHAQKGSVVNHAVSLNALTIVVDVDSVALMAVVCVCQNIQVKIVHSQHALMIVL